MTSETPDERLRDVARSGGISLFGAAANSVLGFLLVVLVSRALGASGAGAFSVAVSVAMTLTVAGRLGTDTALVRTLPRLRELGRDADIRAAVAAALGPVCAGAAALACALWWWAPSIARTLTHDPDGTWLLRLAAVAVPLGACGYVALAATRGLGTIVPLTVVECIVKPAARCVLVGAALLVAPSVLGTMAAWTLAAALGAVLSIGALRRSLRALRRRTDRRAPERIQLGKLPRRPDRRSRATRPDAVGPRATRRELWTFAGPRGVAAVFEIGGMHAGVLLTSTFAGTEQTGVFNAALRLALAGTLAMQALRLAVAPRLSRMLTAGDEAGVEHVHQTSTAWVVLLSFPLYLVFACWPGQVLALFGDDFRAGGTALTVLAAAMLLNLATGNVATVLLMSGRSGLTLAITAGSLALGVGLTVALAPAYGALGAAIAKAASVVFENIAVAVAVRRTLGVRPLSRPIVVATGLAVACFAVPALVGRAVGGGGLAMTVAVLVGLAAYLPAVWRLRRPFELAALAAVVPGPLARRFPVPTAKGQS